MLNQPTIEKLQTMKLHGMADAFREQIEMADSSQLSFEERFGLLVDRQWTWKEGRALTRRLQLAKFKERGVVEDIDYQHPRGLDRKLMRTLATSEWVRVHHNILFIGKTGLGKSWLACALAHKACRDGFFALHKRIAELFRELAVARADGSFGQYLLRLSRIDVLVLDDFAMAPLKEQERRDFLEICDDRYQRRSTILTSQEINLCIQELVHAGVCRLHASGSIQVQECFWPYQRKLSETDTDDPEAYVAAIRRLFLRQGCVSSSFSPADERLAAGWYRRGVPLEQAERAIYLGVARKYVALLNNGKGSPITTLSYFENLIDEVDRADTSPNYWRHVMYRNEQFERRWRANRRALQSTPTAETK